MSSWSHLVSAAAALVSSYFLLRKGIGNRWRVTALVVYSFSLVFLFSMSGVFHMLDRGGAARGVLQRLDHAGIWVLIAGTFTPIHTIMFRGAWRWLVLLVVWTIAITGLTLEVVFFTDFPEALTLGLFIGLGWIGALSAFKFRRLYPGSSMRFLALGGGLYTLGALLDFLRWPTIMPSVFGAHEIFHIFVCEAAICHWIFIYQWADYPVTNRLAFAVISLANDWHIGEALNDRMTLESKDLVELKDQIKAAVRKKYHPHHSPAIALKYLREERIHGI